MLSQGWKSRPHKNPSVPPPKGGGGYGQANGISLSSGSFPEAPYSSELPEGLESNDERAPAPVASKTPRRHSRLPEEANMPDRALVQRRGGN